MLARIISLLAITFFTLNATAFTDEELAKEVKLLLSRINKEHVKPRAVDGELAKSVNLLFIDFLDPNKLIFSKQDEQEFVQKENILLSDLQNETVLYFTFVRERYETRLAALSIRSSEFFAANIPTTFSGKAVKLGDQRPDAAAQTQVWNQYLTETYYGELLDFLKDDQRQFQKDSLAIWSGKTKTALQKRFSDYWKDLKNRDQLGNYFLNSISLSFDPHTYFFTLASKNSFEEELTSEREIYGINLEMNLSGETLISDVAPGSPAWLSNEVHVGDKVRAIRFIGDKEIAFDGSTETFRSVMKTFDQTSAKEIDLTLEGSDRSEKKVRLVKSKVYSDDDIIKNAVLSANGKKIGYVSLPDFYVNWTDTSNLGCANDLAKCLIKLKKDSISGVILDLRGNGGGSLKEAVDIAGIFIDYGPVLATREKGNSIRILKDFNRGSIYNGPLIIMIDERSASASEIVSSTLQDYNRAVIFGTPSFGKATSQAVYSLDPKMNNLSMGMFEEDKSLGYANITNGQLYRINGNWNQLVGVQPDVKWPLEINQSEEHGERSYSNVLVPDPIDKKMIYQPLTKPNIEGLNAQSQQRLTTDSLFSTYAKLVTACNKHLELMEQQPSVLSLDQELAVRNKWLELSDEIEEFQNQLICTFTPSTNHFDRDLFASDEILDMYHRQFLQNLEKDVELMEGVNIMIDLINK